MTRVAILRHGEKSWILFAGKPLVLGSADGCDLRIELHGVAKKHLKLGLLADGSIHVKPLGFHRVEVDGRKVDRGCILREGSSLVFGLAHLEIEEGEAGFGLHLQRAIKENLNGVRRELHKVPWFLSSLAVHLLLIWLLLSLKAQAPIPKGDPANFGMERIGSFDREELRDNEEEAIPSPRIEDPGPPSSSLEVPTFDPLEGDSETEDFIGTGGATENPHGNEALLRPLLPHSHRGGGKGRSLRGLSGALKKRISHLRRTGLEIALCLDSTSSMGETIRHAKGSLKTIFLLLKDLVPSARIAILTYRDKSDAYVVRKTRLGVNLWEGLSFLSSVVAEGGGDFPEAVDQALTIANRLPWKRSSTKVILLVGDAPPHEYPGMAQALRIAKIFKDRGGSVHAMLSGNDPLAQEAFARITKAGNGMRTTLGDGGSLESFASLFLRLALGPTSQRDIPKMLANWRKSHAPSRTNKRKRLQGFRLFTALKSPRPDPRVIETWAQNARKKDLRRLLPQLRRTRLSAEGKHALIYLVNSVLDRGGYSPLLIKHQRNPGEIFSKLKKRLEK